MLYLFPFKFEFIVTI